MKKNFLAVSVLLLVCIIAAPSFAAMQSAKVTKNENSVTPVKEQEMTLGLVQRQIHIGTSQDEVAIAIGSPNIVTTDSTGKETWVYDKVASITSYDSNGFGVGAGGIGGGSGGNGFGGGLLGIGYSKNKNNVQSSQKTLTVVIKFDKNHRVESFSYNMSKF